MFVDKRKLIGSLVGLLAFIVLSMSATYAYFTASVSSANNALSGTTYKFSVDLDLTTIKSAEALIPSYDSDIIYALENTTKCVDDYGYDVCSLYEITLTNSGQAEDLYGYVITGTSNYVTSNLKCALYTYANSVYTLVTDNIVLSHTTNAENSITSSATQYVISMGDGSTTPTTKTYYLVIWLTETETDQATDQDKTYNGAISFESIYGDTITSTFN